jgi:predicted HTH domain antitoxin
MSITIPDVATESPQRLLEETVLALWSAGQISGGKAGRLLGMTRVKFWEFAGERGATWPYTQEMLEQDLRAIEEIRRP